MSTTTTSGTRQRITRGSSPFAPGATIAGKRVERWFPLPSAAPVAQHLDRPLRWGKPRHGILTNDLFDGSLSNEAIAAVFGVMAACPQHTFQILTKRPERMRQWFGAMASTVRTSAGAVLPQERVCDWTHRVMRGRAPGMRRMLDASWPLPNVWLGVSVENRAALTRIDDLRATPASVRFVSFEPLLEDLGEPDLTGISWAIFGGESGPGARPCSVEWIRRGVASARRQGCAPFVKQLGARPTGEPWLKANGKWVQQHYHPARRNELVLNDRKGGDPSEWTEDLRVRQFPGGAP